MGCLSANDAYNEMYDNMFDIIISDIMMPEIDGFEFVETVRKLNAEIPILYMTKLRDKFSGCEEFEIVTVHGLGYKAVLK